LLRQAPASARGRAYGAYNAVVGLAAVPAGLLTGWLWQRFGPLAVPPARREQPSCANAKKFKGTPAGAVGFAACENLIVRQCFVQGRKRLEQERSHDRTRRLDQRVPGIWLQSRLVSAPESMPDEKAVLLRAR